MIYTHSYVYYHFHVRLNDPGRYPSDVLGAEKESDVRAWRVRYGS
jgi:hypothetical protein